MIKLKDLLGEGLSSKWYKDAAKDFVYEYKRVIIQNIKNDGYADVQQMVVDTVRSLEYDPVLRGKISADKLHDTVEIQLHKQSWWKKLTGESLHEAAKLTDADIKVGDAYKTTHSGLMIDFVYEKESRGGATTIEYQFKPQYGAPGFMSVGSGPPESVDGWGKHKKVKVTSKMKKEMIKTLEAAMKSKYKNSEEVDVLIRNGLRLSNVLSWVKRL